MSSHRNNKQPELPMNIPLMISSLPRAGCTFASVLRRIFWQSLLLLALIGAALPSAYATIPAAAVSDPLYAKGYLVVSYYPGVFADGTNEGTTTTGLNEALADAYANNLVAYFPEGTYLVNDTLKAHTATGVPSTDPGYTFATPRNLLALVGSTAGSSRPLIRLVAGAAGFGNAGTPKSLLEFMNFDNASQIGDKAFEKASEGYNQMLRGIDLDCGSGNAGAIGLYFNQAQGSSIENVKVTATGAFAGFKALPGRGCVVVNIEAEGGQYGIDTVGTGAAGAIVAGAVLRNQTVGAVRYDGFVPLILVGFEIVAPSGSSVPVLTTVTNAAANTALVHLIDGRITMTAEPTVAVINNPTGKSIYVRNVYVTGADKLVKSGGNAAVNGTGAWKLINEYSYCSQSAADSTGKISYDMLDGTTTRTPAPLNNGEVYSVSNNVSAPPADLVGRHKWAALPSVDDADAVDAFALGITPGNVSSAALQAVIDANQKVFLRKGIYYLDGTVTLRNDTILFGVARGTTRIEVQPDWNPTSETAMIATDNDATATTYLGDLTIGVDATDLANDWFVALDWQAGRNSMVHIGPVYREPAATVPVNRLATNPHSLFRIRNSGGGRWYHTAAIKTHTSQHADYRILKAEGTTEPLWLYGVNPEHPAGCDAYMEFTSASNIRLYGVKTEFSGDAAWEDQSVLLKYTNVTNVAQFGHGAIRNAVDSRGAIELLGSGTDRVLATLIAPQIDSGTATGDTLRENLGSGNMGVAYPNVVALYKRGAITVADEAAMVHADVSYGPGAGNVPPAVQITSPTEGAIIPSAPAPITANASDSDGAVVLVEFYANGVFIDDDITSPYGVTWTPAATGPFSLNAIAYDDLGAPNISATVNVTVQQQQQQATFTSAGTDDGWVLESSENSNTGGSISAGGTGTTALRVGDDNKDKQYKTIVSFDTSSIPDGATILSATLKLTRGSVSGINPFTTHGVCYVDIKTWSFNGNSALENTDFQAAPTVSQVATMSNPASNGALSSGDLNPSGLSVINKTGKTQLRIYLSTDDNNDNGNDYIGFYSGENATAANRPVLEVTYQ